MVFWRQSQAIRTWRIGRRDEGATGHYPHQSPARRRDPGRISSVGAAADAVMPMRSGKAVAGLLRRLVGRLQALIGKAVTRGRQSARPAAGQPRPFTESIAGNGRDTRRRAVR